MFLRGRDKQIIGGRQKGWRNKLKEVTVLLRTFRAAGAIRSKLDSDTKN